MVLSPKRRKRVIILKMKPKCDAQIVVDCDIINDYSNDLRLWICSKLFRRNAGISRRGVLAKELNLKDGDTVTLRIEKRNGGQ